MTLIFFILFLFQYHVKIVAGKKNFQITPLKHTQSSHDPLNYFLVLTPLNYIFGSIYPLVQFIVFVSLYTTLVQVTSSKVQMLKN